MKIRTLKFAEFMTILLVVGFFLLWLIYGISTAVGMLIALGFLFGGWLLTGQLKITEGIGEPYFPQGKHEKED